jgi:hypothetical protein
MQLRDTLKTKHTTGNMELTVITYNNVQKLTSLNLPLMTTVLTPLKPQISKFQAEKSGQGDFNVLRRLYSRALVKRIKLFAYMLAYYLSVFVLLATVHIF